MIKKYIYGPKMDNPVAMIAVDGETETWYYYYTDVLGSIRLMTDAGGDVVEGYTYDPFGKPRVMTSAGEDHNWLTEDVTTQSASGIGNPYMFTGRRWYYGIGLYYYRFRDYAPDLGRFLQTDPAGYIDTLNLYAYCANNPINWIDPWGLFPIAGYYGYENYDRFPENCDDLEEAYNYIMENYPEIYTGNTPIFSVMPLPSDIEGIGALGSIIIDREQIKKEWKNYKVALVNTIAHELMHLEDGFWKTLLLSEEEHWEIYKKADEISRAYSEEEEEKKKGSGK